MLLLRKARRDLARRKRPFLALTFMIVLGVASLTSIYGAYANLRESIDETHAELNLHDALIETRPTTRETLLDAARVGGVADAEARFVAELPVAFENDEPPVMATVIGLPSREEARIDKLRYLAGAAPSKGARDVVVESGFAAHHGVRVGDLVRITTPQGETSARVAGVALSPEYLWPAKTAQEHMPDVLRRWGAMWMPEDALTALTGTPGAANQVLLETAPGASPDDAVAAAATALGADAVVRSETRERQASNVVLGLLVSAVNQMAYVLPVIFLSIVGLSTYVLLTRLVHEQRANVGLLRALGYRPGAILLHYLTDAPLVAGAGTLVGFGLGYVLSFFVTDVFGSYVSLADIPVRLRLDLLAAGFLLSLGFAGAASALPALSASRLRPSESMRPPTPTSARRSILERAVPHAPASVRLGLRNVGRNRRRSAFTVLGVALAVSVLVVPQVVLDSLDNVTEVAVVRVQVADEILVFREPASRDALADAAQIEGVARIEPLVRIQGTFERDGRTRDVTIMGLAPESELMRLTDAAGARVRTTSEGVLLSRVYERDGIRAGDSLRLRGEDVRVVGFTQASGTTGFVDIATAERWAGTPDASNQAMLEREPGARAADVRERLALALPIAATLDVAQAIQDTRDMMRLYYAIVYLTLAFGVAIAAAIVYNTVSINVLEESRDFATLRTLGVPTRSLLAQTTTETLALAVPGALAGLGVGVILARSFVGTLSTDLFVLDLHVRAVSLIRAFALCVVVALVAEVPSVRRVARLDLAQATRERAS